MNYSDTETIDGDAEVIEQALPLLPEIGKLLHAVKARNPQAFGMTHGQMRAMLHLHYHGRCTVGEIAGGLGVALPTASELVEQLVEAGLAERTGNPADRRQVLVDLTPAARRRGEEMGALRRAQLRAALARLAPEERPVFLRSLQALVEALRQNPG